MDAGTMFFLIAVVALALVFLGRMGGLLCKVLALLVNGCSSVVFVLACAALSPAKRALLFWALAWVAYMATICAFMWKKLRLARVWAPLALLYLALAAVCLGDAWHY